MGYITVALLLIIPMACLCKLTCQEGKHLHFVLPDDLIQSIERWKIKLKLCIEGGHYFEIGKFTSASQNTDLLVVLRGSKLRLKFFTARGKSELQLQNVNIDAHKMTIDEASRVTVTGERTFGPRLGMSLEIGPRQIVELHVTEHIVMNSHCMANYKETEKETEHIDIGNTVLVVNDCDNCRCVLTCEQVNNLPHEKDKKNRFTKTKYYLNTSSSMCQIVTPSSLSPKTTTRPQQKSTVPETEDGIISGKSTSAAKSPLCPVIVAVACLILTVD